MERSVAGILIRDGRAFVAKRGSEGSFSGRWEFPGGKVERGESDAEALVREFDEEFGMVVRPIKLLAETVFPHRGSDRTLAAWLIEASPESRPRLIEHEELRWADAGELRSLELVDSDGKILPNVLALIAT